jgi:phage shock protein A
LERALEEANKRYNEKLKSLKDETGFEYTDTIEKLSNEKANLEQRLENKRNEFKKHEGFRSKQVNNLEKDKAVLQEKLSTIEGKMSDLEERYASDLKDLSR